MTGFLVVLQRQYSLRTHINQLYKLKRKSKAKLALDATG